MARALEKISFHPFRSDHHHAPPFRPKTFSWALSLPGSSSTSQGARYFSSDAAVQLTNPATGPRALRNCKIEPRMANSIFPELTVGIYQLNGEYQWIPDQENRQQHINIESLQGAEPSKSK